MSLYKTLQYDSPEYLEWVRREIKPIQYDVEEYVFTQNWAPFMPHTQSTPDPAEVVLMVQSSPERLPFVKRMIHHWGGPVAAACYIPYPKHSAAGIQCRSDVMRYIRGSTEELQSGFALSLLYGISESPNNHCNLTIDSNGLTGTPFDADLWHQQFDGAEFLDLYDRDYPVNALRNLAKTMVHGNVFLFLMDADFVPTTGLHSALVHGDTRAALLEMRRLWERKRARRALIIPAFERMDALQDGVNESCSSEHCWLYGGFEVPGTKARLTEMVKLGSVQPFHAVSYQQGHGCYFPSRWLESSRSYYIPYTHPCEPYIIALSYAMPVFDERFRGRRLDKVSFLTHLAALGTEFAVEPHHFIMHLPHQPIVPLDALLRKFPARLDRMIVARVLMKVKQEELRQLNREGDADAIDDLLGAHSFGWSRAVWLVLGLLLTGSAVCYSRRSIPTPRASRALSGALSGALV